MKTRFKNMNYINTLQQFPKNGKIIKIQLWNIFEPIPESE